MEARPENTTQPFRFLELIPGMSLHIPKCYPNQQATEIRNLTYDFALQGFVRLR
jgi:hypothetical protein